MDAAIVTGATGFIGRHLVKELVKKGVKVCAVIRPLSKNKQIIESISSVKNVYCELENLDRLPDILGNRQFDTFYHLGWEGSSGDKRYDYNLQIDNVKNIIKAVEVAKKLGCIKFVGSGSLMEFECQQVAMCDGRKPGQSNIYSTAKLAAHYMSKTRASEIGITHIWGYITNAYGEDEESPRFFNTTLRKMIKGDRLDFTEGMQLYDFVHVSDVATAFLLLGEKGQDFVNYCVGSGQPRLLKDYVISMRNIVNPKLGLNFGGVPSTGINLPADIYNIEKLRRHTGYIPNIMFEEGVQRVTKYISESV